MEKSIEPYDRPRYEPVDQAMPNRQPAPDIAAALADTARCVAALRTIGIVVDSLEIRGGLPIVQARYGRGLDNLDGAWFIRESNGRGLRYRWEARLHNCKVRWFTTSGGA